MRTAPAVCASLARWYPDFPFRVCLFDANPERLDLADLLIRSLLEEWNDEIPVLSSLEPGEAIQSATHLVVSMHEDCARRILGRGNSTSLDYFEQADELDLYRGGDRNRPTPVEQLSEQTRRLLSFPADEGGTREEAIQKAVTQWIEGLAKEAQIVSLARGVALDFGRPYRHLNWPEPQDGAQSTLVPHQILRWVRGDEKTAPLAELAERSPLMAWLKDSEAG